MPRALSSAVCILGGILLAGCTSVSSGDRLAIHLHVTSAAYPWLELAYDCVPPTAAIVLSDDPAAALILRLAEPPELSSPAFQVGVDDLLVVTHRQVGVGPLEASQVEALFAGQVGNWRDLGGADQDVQVWVYSPGVDIQEVFSALVLHGRPVSSWARLATSAQHMSDSVGSTPGSIGLLPRRWKAGNTAEVMMVGTMPVLLISIEPPQGPVAELIACMQATE